MSIPILGYWDMRCYAEPIRHMLKYAQVQFVDKRYSFKKDTSKDYHAIRNEWFSEKFTHGLDFPNMPYYIDGDIKVLIKI